MGRMAKARVGRDDRGRLGVFGRGVMSGVERRRRIVIPAGDEALAEETAHELNRRLALGDLSWFEREAKQPNHPRRVPTFTEWSQRWLDDLEGQVTVATFRDYRGHLRDLTGRIGNKRLDRVTPGDSVAVRNALTRQGLRHRTIRNRLMVVRMVFRDARLAGLMAATPPLRWCAAGTPSSWPRSPATRRAAWWSRSTTRSSTPRTGPRELARRARAGAPGAALRLARPGTPSAPTVAGESETRNSAATHRRGGGIWRARHDSNMRPPGPQPGALSN